MGQLYVALLIAGACGKLAVVQTSILALLFAVYAFGQDCLPYDQAVTIRGSLAQRDENGYRRWVALRPERPLCTIASIEDEFSPAERGIKELQASYTDSDRLQRLVGSRVLVEGKLSGAFNGYHRTAVLIALTRIDPLDAAGEAALSAAKPPQPIVKEPSSYEIVIHAGRRLTKEARENGSNKRLTPTADFAPHWVNGGEVLYANCRDGYEIRSTSSTPPQATMCEGTKKTCIFFLPVKETITLKMHCVKQP